MSHLNQVTRAEIQRVTQKGGSKYGVHQWNGDIFMIYIYIFSYLKEISTQLNTWDNTCM